MTKTILKCLLFASVTIGAYADSQNSSFTKTVARNRANGDGTSSNYISIDGNKEFKEALENGLLEGRISSDNKHSKTYVYRDIQNVRINRHDLKELKGDTLHLGSQSNENGIVQTVNIKNARIDTDKHINLGIISHSSDVSDTTTSTTIRNSQLLGKDTHHARREKKGITTSQYFD